jgi:uncharacterized protein
MSPSPSNSAPSHDDPAADWETRFASFLDRQMSGADAAHDRAHVRRVVTTALDLARIEEADPHIVRPAAWLHDCVALPKDHPDRHRASQRAADEAVSFLEDAGYPTGLLPAIRHAIEAHSFSAGIEPRSLEAQVVQDADRLDALGAIGIARCFMVGGSLDRQLYDPRDPFCTSREPDDGTYTLDHFYEKLLDLPATMQTSAGRAEARRRADFMRTYLDRLAGEIDADPRSS